VSLIKGVAKKHCLRLAFGLLHVIPGRSSSAGIKAFTKGNPRQVPTGPRVLVPILARLGMTCNRPNAADRAIQGGRYLSDPPGSPSFNG
jgi:hypothetical protein